MYDIISIGSATRDVFFGADELKKFKMEDFPTGEAIVSVMVQKSK